MSGRLILDCPDSVDTGVFSPRLTDNQTRPQFFFTPIRTGIRTGWLCRTSIRPRFCSAPRLIRTADLLIRSHPSRRVDTFLRGVTRADALADGQTRGLATPHSG